MKPPTLENEQRMPLSAWIGYCVAKRRDVLKVSQRAFAQKCGIARSDLGRIERGQQTMTIDTLERICSTLGISVMELMAEAIRRESAKNLQWA